MRAVKKLIEVDDNKSVTVTSLPFEPGSKVEVIVLSADKKEDVFAPHQLFMQNDSGGNRI